MEGLKKAISLSLVIALFLSCTSLLASPPGWAAGCGEVLVDGSNWAGGNGVDVRSNHPNQGTGNSCATGSVYDLTANPPRWGLGWQCVELAARLYKTKGWSNGLPGISYAAQIYTNATKLGMTAMTQGAIDIHKIKPGDMVVSDQGIYGHVSLVDYVSGNNIHIVEQNANADGKGVYSFSNGMLTRGSYYHVTGVVQSPQNRLFRGGASNPSTFADGQIVENLDTNPRFHYVAAGNRLFWYDRFNAAQENAFIDQMRRRLGSNAQIAQRYGEEIHAVEANYPAGAAHRPNNNTFMYEYPGGTTQYMIQYDYAFPLVSAEEIVYLGGVDKAVMVPPGSIGPLLARADAMPYITNARALKALANPDYYEVQDGMLYWLNNFTVLDCLVRYKGGTVQQVPASLINKFIEVGRRTGRISHCDFPSNVAFYGPGGVERWYIYGTNPYDRYQYASEFAMFCRIGQEAPQVEISTPGINQAAEKVDQKLQCPNGSFVRNRQNNEVFHVIDGVLHYVASFDTMRCLARGNPPDPKGIDEVLLRTVQRGANAVCDYEGKMVQTPTGPVYWIKDGQRHYVGNDAILNCIRIRASAGSPIPASQETINTYPGGYSGYCPYPSDVRFVRGDNQTPVWRVFSDGTRQHALSLCAANAESSSIDPRLRVHVVPAGEVDGHRLRNPDSFSATPETCAAIP